MTKKITDDFIRDLAKNLKTKQKQKESVLDREQLFGRVKKNYKRLRVETNYPNEQWQIDLIDMSSLSRYNSGFRYILIVIDVYSRYVWARKLKTKNAMDVLKKFESVVVDNNNILPRSIHSDKGGEFAAIKKKCLNGSFGKVVKYQSSENYEMKSVVVERFIRTLRMMISNVLYGLYGKIEARYTNVLDKIIEKYNDSSHLSLNKNKPKDIYYEKVKIPRVFKYKKYFEFRPFYRKGMILKEGQKVRVSQLKSRFEKESTFKWSKEIFKIVKVRLTDPITYIISDLNDNVLSGVFYREELLKI